jgi:RsiW-degrading membrane proteinase PrsW (M82 family)
MFKNKTSHSVIGIEAPWLYLRVLFFMLMCTGIAAVASLFGITMPFVIIGSLCSVLPLMIFLFESNFARNLSIIDVLKMFAIGGLGSICLVAITNIMYEAIDETIVTVVFAPLLEEICKAFMVIYLVSKIKPTNMITGLLIGFSVGAGFSFFENVQYGTSSYLSGLIEYGDGAVESMVTIAHRTIVEFLMGHHYWTGIFGAVYVLFKKDTKYNTNDLFQWKVMAALAFSIALHMMWNGSYMMDILIIPSIIRILVGALSVGALIILIDIGITQTRLFGIWRDYQSERKEEML